MPSTAMLRRAAALCVALVALAVTTAAQGPSDTSRAGGPRPVSIRLGALLPLSGPSAWYGEEMRHGLELAVIDLNPPAPTLPAPSATSGSPPRAGAGERATDATAGRTPGVQLHLDVQDVPPLDVKEIVAAFTRLAAAGATAVFTASGTPTLAVQPHAAGRDILVIHQGVPTGRLLATSQTILRTRPTAASQGQTLAGYAWERGLRRLALLSAGDEFGKAVRAAFAARWRDRGGALAFEESLSPDAPDLGSRLALLMRSNPEAVALGFRGDELAELIRSLRQAGHAGLVLALDDDPAVLLAAGPAMTDLVILADAFVPEPDSAGERFANAYAAKYGRPPSRFAAHAYQAALILAEGAAAAGKGGTGAPGGARLREALLARREFPSILPGRIIFREDGTLERPLALFTVDRGRSVFVRYVDLDGRPAGARPATSRP